MVLGSGTVRNAPTWASQKGMRTYQRLRPDHVLDQIQQLPEA